MEAAKCISTSSAATAKKPLTINDLDDDSLGMIFNKLPYLDRTHIESVCQRWYDVSNANWWSYSKRLRIPEDLRDFRLVGRTHYNTTERFLKEQNVQEKILQRSGLYLEEIIFMRSIFFCLNFAKGTIKWIAELCPKLKRLNTGFLKLSEDDWLACSNLEAFSFSMQKKGNQLAVFFQRNKRVRRLDSYSNSCVKASDFDYLDAGQLEFLRIEYCQHFVLTDGVADKLAESLVELMYSPFHLVIYNLTPLGKLKNLRSLDLKVAPQSSTMIKFIIDIVKNCQKLESLFLSITTEDYYSYNVNIFAPLLDLPCLRRLVIIVTENAVSCEKRHRLLQRATHLELFVIETCAKCKYASYLFEFCDRHRRGWKW